MLSTRDLLRLPDMERLRQRLQQMSALNAVFNSLFNIEDYSPQFEFHPKWARSEQMGAIKNGSGDELFVHFTKAGCIIIGFAHESSMSPYRTNPPELWPSLVSNVPAEFKASLNEPAFDIASTTFVIWRLATDNAWQTGAIKYPNDTYGDGSQDLLSPLISSSVEFADWLAENYEVEVNSDIVESVFANKPLTDEQLSELNPDTTIVQLRKAVTETGYAVVKE